MLYFIVNALSGKGKGKEAAAKIKALLNEKKVSFAMAFTEAKEHAVKLAREFSQKPDCEGVVAVGGDGTFSEVVNGVSLDVPVGFISSGSGNDFMRSFKAGVSIESQLEPILEGKTRKIDFIEVNDRRCLNVCGTGFDVDILNCEKRVRKVVGGSLGYYVALLITVFRLKNRQFDMLVDGEKVSEESVIISIANGKFFGGGMPVSLASEIDDGIMQLQIVKRLPFYRIPDVLLRFLKGTVTKAKKYVDVYNCKEIECRVTPEVEINLDGELHKMPVFKARINHGGLKVFG